LFTGHWDVYYKRTRNGVEIKSPVLSLTLTDHVNPPVPTGLEAPILPQVMNGSLDLTFLTEPVIVKIPAWEGITPGDDVTLYIGGHSVGKYYVSQS
ncbi:hypothetical protein OZI60_27530, partial [Escherichia coli]|uniref:hypothetical protein n=1 Tax=Escherichia coli TaxID=562 RepID=UPI0022840993